MATGHSNSDEVLASYISFAVPIHQIDSRTLGISLIETENLLKTVVRQHNTEMEVQLQVEALSPGSFEVLLNFSIDAGAGLLAVEPVLPFLKQSMQTMIEFIKLKRLLKGGVIQETQREYDGSISITGDNNEVYNFHAETVNVYEQQPQAHDAVEHQFSSLEADKGLQGFEIRNDSHEPLLQIPKDQFGSLSTRVKQTTINREDIFKDEETTLIVTKVVLKDVPATWQFADEEGNTYSARMLHEGFLQRIRDGESFAIGDRMRVELRTIRSYDEHLGIHKIKKREILKVFEHSKRRVYEQTEMKYDG